MRPTFSRVAGGLGALLLVASVYLPWFQVPDALPRDSGVAFAVIGREAPVTLAVKALALGVLVAFVLVLLRGPPAGSSRRRFAAVASATLFGLLLFFPHAVMVWCPATAGRANWLHVQHESLTWFGGDVFGLQEIKDFDWKSRVYAADLLDQATSMNTPSWSPNAVPFGSLHELFAWFGYSNAFCQFVRAGWGVALAGAFVIFLAACRAPGGPDLALFRTASARAVAVVAAGVVLALIPASLGAIELDRARDAAQRGLPEAALDRIEVATWVVPVIAQSSDLVLERGLLEARLGVNSPAATLYLARVLQRQGLLEQAEALFATLLGRDVPGAVRREAIRGLMRRGIRELNSGETSHSVESLETVLRADPCNVKANYVLELAYLRASRFDSLRDLASTMRATYHYFSDETKVPILAAAQENLADAAYLQNDPRAAHAVWKTLGDAKTLTGR